MSDSWGPDSTPNGGDGPPSPPPPPPPPVAPDLDLTTESTVSTKKGIGGRVAAGAVGVALLVGGSAFALTQSGDDGPSTPEAAVDALLDAASNEDVLGVLAAMEPGERDLLRDSVQGMFSEFERLEVVDDSFELTGIEGIDIEFSDVTYRVEDVRPGLSRVYFTGGEVSGTIKADELPIGEFVQDTLDRFEADISGFEESGTEPITDDDTFLAVVDGDDGWRVSIGYTAAEAARTSAGLPVPTDVITPIGADSPEAAVEGMMRSIASLDTRDMVARLSPTEFRALQEYLPLFVDLDAATAEAQGAVTMSVDNIELSSDTSGDKASVYVDALGMTIEVEGETVSFDYAESCVAVETTFPEFQEVIGEFDLDPSNICIDDLNRIQEEAIGSMGLGLTPAVGFGGPADFDYGEIGITTVRSGGEWYVAPLTTYLDLTITGLQAMERADLDTMVETFETMFYGGFEQSFEVTGDAIGGFDDFESFEDFGEEFEGGLGPGVTALSPDDVITIYESGQTWGLGLDPADERLIADTLFGAFAADPVVIDCMMFELAFLSTDDLQALVTSIKTDTDPSQDLQQFVFESFDYCA